MIMLQSEDKKKVEKGFVMFYYPFVYKGGKEKYIKKLLNNDWVRWPYENENFDSSNYFGGMQVDNYHLNRYFVNHTRKVLFPENAEQQKEYAFERYSRVFNMFFDCKLKLEKKAIEDRVLLLSTDIILCGMDIGFLVLKVDYSCNNDKKTLKELITFIEYFRMLEKEYREQTVASVSCDGKIYEDVYKFICRYILPRDFHIEGTKSQSNDSINASQTTHIPYIYNTRMFSFVYISVSGSLNEVDKFMIANVDSYVPSSNNLQFIKAFNEKHFYHRWEPVITYSIIDYAAAIVVETEKKSNNELYFEENILPSHFFGCYYYIVLLQLFYRSVLLKLSYNYSQVDEDINKAKKLQEETNKFQQFYYYSSVTNQVQGIELWDMFTDLLDNDRLFSETNKEISEINSFMFSRRQENLNRNIRILTVFALLNGTFGIGRFVGKEKETFRSLFEIQYWTDCNIIDSVFNLFAIILFFVSIGYATKILFFKDAKGKDVIN